MLHKGISQHLCAVHNRKYVQEAWRASFKFEFKLCAFDTKPVQTDVAVNYGQGRINQ